MDVNVEVISKGRGLGYKRNIREIRIEEEKVRFEVYGEPTECLLGMVRGLVQGMPDAKIPFLLFPDGTGEVALDFEEQDETGKWNTVDLRELMK